MIGYPWFAILLGVLIAGFALFLRIGPLWRNRERGCDAYYYLLCVEELKKKRKLPIKLPTYFLLDIQEQWYPPLFPVFLSFFSQQFLDKFHWILSPLIDITILIVLYGITLFVTSNFVLAALAAFLYALAPILMMQNSSLNSRPLGSFCFHATILAMVGFFLTAKPIFLILILVFGFFLLMCHKLSTQAMIVTFVILAVALDYYQILLFLLLIFVGTWILSMGFYWKVLKGHIDILAFWKKHWPYYGANMVKHSPLYGKEKVVSTIYQQGIAGYGKHLRILIGGNLFVLMLPFSWMLLPSFTLFDKVMLWIALALYLAAFATRFIPFLRFLGEGEKYLNPAALLVAYLGARIALLSESALYMLIFLIVCTLYLDWRVWNKLAKESRSNLARIDADLQKVFAFLKKKKSIRRVICIPNHTSEAVVYFCRKAVVWGAHSDHFKAIAPYFPVLRKPLGWFKQRYKATYLLLNTEYAEPKVLKLRSSQRTFKTGKYSLYRI